MLRVLSEEEALKSRKKAFAKIKQGSLFNLGGWKDYTKNKIGVHYGYWNYESWIFKWL